MWQSIRSWYRLLVGAGCVALMLVGIGSLIQNWLTYQVLQSALEHNNRLADITMQAQQSLVQELRGLSERTASLSTSSGSLVQFRFRYAGTMSQPSAGFTVVLSQVNPTVPLADFPRDMSTSQSGCVSFGLLPAGRYRLQTCTEYGYELQHEFDVWPGAPVDCVVPVPLGAPAESFGRLRVTGLGEAGEDSYAVVARLSATSFEQDGWVWKPCPGKIRDVYVGLLPGAQPAVQEELQASLENFLSDELTQAEHAMLPSVSEHPDGRFPLESRFYELVSLTIARQTTTGDKETFRGRSGFTPVVHWKPADTIEISANGGTVSSGRPLYREFDPLREDPWMIDLPREVRSAVRPQAPLPQPTARHRPFKRLGLDEWEG